jgi:ribosomal-protein-alanine N-acetyltransferase
MSRPFPILVTARVELSPFDPSKDACAVFAYASDHEVARFTSWMPHKSLADSAAWIESILRSDSSKPGQRHHCWAIRARSDDPIAVGAVELAQDSVNTARVDFVLARHLWRKGLMTEAVTAVMDWGFHTLHDVDVIRTGALAVNLGSIGVMKKCGFILESTKWHVFPKFGNAENEVMNYVISRQDWAKSNL